MRARNQVLMDNSEEHVGVMEAAAGWVPYDSGNPALHVSLLHALIHLQAILDEAAAWAAVSMHSIASATASMIFVLTVIYLRCFAFSGTERSAPQSDSCWV